jgi:hypothetical protein
MAADSGIVRGGSGLAAVESGNAGVGAGYSGFQNQVAGQTGIPVRSVTIRLEAYGGTSAAPAGTRTISIPIPEKLSLRVAKMHVLEQVLAELKKSVAEPLKAIGCK